MYCVCRQYAGTGALKSGFTRTGKRTVAGLIDDGIKSMTRYYLNNFKVRVDTVVANQGPAEGCQLQAGIARSWECVTCVTCGGGCRLYLCSKLFPCCSGACEVQ